MPATIHCFVLLQLKYHHGKLLTLLGKFAQIILKNQNIWKYTYIATKLFRIGETFLWQKVNFGNKERACV
jgi:hypothetical protein